LYSQLVHLGLNYQRNILPRNPCRGNGSVWDFDSPSPEKNLTQRRKGAKKAAKK
jgi:hypothetical protein